MKKRKAEKLIYKQINSKIFRKIYNVILRVVFACDFPVSVEVGNGLMLPHNGLGVVVHNKTIIGNNVTIYQNVTIGGNAKIKDGKIVNSGAPIIEDNVAIFSGACVLGPITIGNGSYVGANAVCTKDVPPNSIVVGYNIIKAKKEDYNLGR